MAARYSIFAARAVFDLRLSAMEVRVLAALGTYSDNEGWCFPSQKTLTERLDCSRSTVGAAIKKLVEIGYVQVRARTSKGRGKVGNEYRVDTNLPPESQGEKPMSNQPDIGGQVIETAPMCDTPDIGADVQLAGQPMSENLDIGIYRRTTPSERPQSVLGKEPKTDRRSKPDSTTAKKRKPKTRVEYPPEFEAVWRLWPPARRANSDKRTAHRRWLDGVKSFGADKVAEAARRYITLPATKKENYRYCCLVEVFMNGKLEAAVEAVTESPKPRRVWSSDANAWVEA